MDAAPETHRLLLYLKIEDNLALVDTIFSDVKSELVIEAEARKAQNPDYITILLSYALTSANIV